MESGLFPAGTRLIHRSVEGSVEISEEDGRIVILPPRKELSEMLSRITSDNMHSPIETGSSVGNEEW